MFDAEWYKRAVDYLGVAGLLSVLAGLIAFGCLVPVAVWCCCRCCRRDYDDDLAASASPEWFAMGSTASAAASGSGEKVRPVLEGQGSCVGLDLGSGVANQPPPPPGAQWADEPPPLVLRASSDESGFALANFLGM